MQNVKGKFDIIFRGTVFLAISKSVLMAEESNGRPAESVAVVWSVHLTPLIAFGFVTKEKIKKSA